MELKTESPKIEAIDRNIATIHRMRKDSDEGRRSDQKFVDHIANFAGTTSFLYAHVFFYGSWFFIGRKTEAVGVTASLEAIFLSVFVLINQRRLNAVERKNSDLHLQMSLLAEHEVTKLARVTDLIAQRLGVNTPETQDLEDVKKDIHPDDILKRISDHEKSSPTDLTSDHSKIADLDRKTT